MKNQFSTIILVCLIWFLVPENTSSRMYHLSQNNQLISTKGKHVFFFVSAFVFRMCIWGVRLKLVSSNICLSLSCCGNNCRHLDCKLLWYLKRGAIKLWKWQLWTNQLNSLIKLDKINHICQRKKVDKTWKLWQGRSAREIEKSHLNVYINSTSIRNLKTPGRFDGFSVDEKHLKTELFENGDVTIILRFPRWSIPQTQMQCAEPKRFSSNRIVISLTRLNLIKLFS